MNPVPLTEDERRSILRGDHASKSDHVEKEARSLAASHPVAYEPGEPDSLAEGLRAQSKILREAYQHFVRLSEREFKQTYAAEWLLDNFHVVQHAFREIEQGVPPSYYARLPKLTNSPLKGEPRVYAIAAGIHAVCNGLLQIDEITRFADAYQETTALEISELWALPVMCRVAVLQSLAEAVARVTGLSGFEAKGHREASAPIERPPDETIIANAILSLRTLDAVDWKDVFERLSLVEHILRMDPSQSYESMDFETRDWYRKEVEKLSRKTKQSEIDVANSAIRLSQGQWTQGPGPDERESHVGYYLIGPGRTRLEHHLGCVPSLLERVLHWLLGRPTLLYLGSVGIIACAIFSALGVYVSHDRGTVIPGPCILLLAAVPVLMCASALVNWFLTHTLPPRLLPKLDFSKGIPPESETIAVVPALLTDADEIAQLMRQIELHFLCNDDPHLSFALLTDFTDAPSKHMDPDQGLLDLAIAGIERLNGQYGRSIGNEARGSFRRPFYLLHRERQWNASEGIWMGWERKRGKIEEFNRLLAGEGATSYVVQIGSLERLPRVRYVVTLDADTMLPRGTARRLVGIMAHPLNRPKFDQDTGQVIAGYTVLQPRIQIKPSSANQSYFTRVFAGDVGFDLYTRAVSDVYQDLFGEGIYVGKGIYDLSAFQRGLAGRVPQNALLSHDLFEGLHVGVALATDVTLVEDYPPTYVVYARRQHRWIRGDWQLVPWLLHWLRHPGRVNRPRRLPVIAYWKILDNLFRSLFSTTLLSLLAMAWLGLLGSPLPWTLLVFLVLALPLLTSVLSGLADCRPGRSMRTIVSSVRYPAVRWLSMIAFLPYEALIAVDAIVRTLFRLTITRKHLLQWITAAHTVRLFGKNDSSVVVWQEMAAAPFFVLGLAILVRIFNPGVLLLLSPLLSVWFVSPEIAYRLSLPLRHRRESLPLGQRYVLRRIARRTWFYFEQFVGPEDQWLPLDHFQEAPLGLPAHRTSPTNVGLMMVSALAAYDLGYIGAPELAMRLQPTFETVEKLERYRGHLLNWYDTRTSKPLSPRYVSTVDSGNLAASLMTLKAGCLAICHAPLMRWQHLQGLLDTLDVLDEVAEHLKEPAPDAVASLQAQWDRIRRRVVAAKDDPSLWARLLSDLNEEERPELDRRVLALVEEKGSDLDTQSLGSLRLWIERIHHQLRAATRDVSTFVPWLPMFDHPPDAIVNLIHPQACDAWERLKDTLPRTPRLDEVGEACETAQAFVARLAALLPAATDSRDELRSAMDWLTNLSGALETATMNAGELLDSLHRLGQRADACIDAMDFEFLFDRKRQLFRIGYNVDAEQLDANYYDLLASEARIASLVAIAKGDVPQAHWLCLARPLAAVNGDIGLLSWSGSMFEYLMPTLFLNEDDDSLLGRADLAAIERHIAYSRQKCVPWGISEAGFYQFDQHMNYQYRAFGVPPLGYKRGLEEDLVVAPYASLLALAFRPKTVMDNISSLIGLGMLGNYGMYEAVDYTPTRLTLGERYAIVRSFYTHHQGMIFLSMANYLLDGVMVSRFHSDPRIQGVELLLQEQIPERPRMEDRMQEESALGPEARPKVGLTSWSVPTQTPVPLVHFLSNGDYRVLITNGGSGYSEWKDIALTRWRADTTLDDWGTWIYIREHRAGGLLSATYQPTAGTTQMCEVSFAPDKVDFRSQAQDIAMHLEITVPPREPIEIRCLSITNRSDRRRRLEVMSFGEVVLAPLDVDRRHQAFNKLFVESEYLPETNALLFRRRTRSADEAPVFMIHGLVLADGNWGPTRYETDRAQFVGRQGTCVDPRIFREDGPTSERVGATLDPVMALGADAELEANQTVRLAFITLAAESRRKALLLAARYRTWPAIERAFSQVRSQSELELSQLDLTTQDLRLIQELLSAVLYPGPALRAEAHVLAANRKGQSDLWPYAISGDYPILLASIGREEELPLVQELLRAHTYWRNRGLKIDLAILNAKETGYAQEIQGQLLRLLARTGSDAWMNRRGGIFIVRRDQVSELDVVLLRTAARAVFDGDKGPLAEQMKGLWSEPARLPAFIPILSEGDVTEITPPLPRPPDLVSDNGLGGFTPDGREYVVYLEPGHTTPAPWVNVISNPYLGFLVSESSLGCTWAINSSENRLTPWSNDPVSDTPAEALYVRDEETGRIWSPTPLPAGEKAPYLIRHGVGYSVFEHHSHGLGQRVHVFAALDDPVKFIKVRLQNTRARPRRITVTYYVEWVLGSEREKMQQYVVSEYDERGQALLVRNAYNAEFGDRVAFMCTDREIHGLTACRTEFLGRMGNLREPAALRRIGLASKTGPGTDPCGAVQVHVDLLPGEAKEICFIMGEGGDRQHALSLAMHYRQEGKAEAARKKMTAFWDSFLDAIVVETPDPAMDRLLNRWLLYQTLSCRLWGRSAFYQSSGAYGFRDQLQDVMALLHTRPEFVRAQILEAAAHQFEEGDVLHWWHPPSGRGVRTRISDDLLWLPFVLAHYVKVTGDRTILAETVPFIKGRPLASEEEERYGQYEATSERYHLFEHCQRSVRKASTSGPHGLPLIGAGDWNDGMNRVGLKGRGESVWLGWFLYTVWISFAEICDLQEDVRQGASLREQAEELRRRLESNTWDGSWYLRAYYDYGVPLGSSRSRECQIDSIAQSWSVLSGAGEVSHVRKAMDEVKNRLVKPDEQLVQLLAPPFDKTPHDPGYIKGYPPGVRENGGQYTHAAVWVLWAFAELGEGDLAWNLFRMLDPIHHSDTPEKRRLYMVEPYVVASDVYAAPPYTGRGGWTWYTGASGWMYRAGIEVILGLRREGSLLRIEPCIPKDWEEYRLRYRVGKTRYLIHVQNPDRVSCGVTECFLDGHVLPGKDIPLVDDGRLHQISVRMGAPDTCGSAAKMPPPSRYRSCCPSDRGRPMVDERPMPGPDSDDLLP